MTIRAGQPWGEIVALPTTVRIVDDDRGLRDWIVAHRTRDADIADVAVRNGDLVRACGAGGADRFGGEVLRVPVDALAITLDRGLPTQRSTWAVSTVVARRSWWRGEVYVVTNAGFAGAYDVAPRSHPNDGVAELLHVDRQMPWRARRAALRRARTGTHLPHPQLSLRRGRTLHAEFARPLVAWADGTRLGTASSLDVTVEADALHVYL